MTSTEIRNLTFAELQGRVCGLRETVLSALRMHGPCTTRQLAAKAGLDILTVRPRVTELIEIGFVELVTSTNAGGRGAPEGVYRARTHAETVQAFNDAQALARGEGVQTSMF